MIRRSADARWWSPGFALRRLLRRPTIDARLFAPAPEAVAAAEIGARVALARCGRGAVATPCALLAGPAPRSGTNFIEALIAAHPAVAAAPGGLREIAALSEARRLDPFAAALAARHGSAGAVGGTEWLGYALAGLLHRVAAERPEAGLILLKDPHARGLDLLRAVLPDATLILVLRDGRRTVDSARRTWPAKGLRRWLGRSFADHCREWALATEAALDHAAREPSAVVLRFEDAVADPAGTAAWLWARLGLRFDAEAARRAAAAPVLGSSTHSRGAAGVDWRPRAPQVGFDPAWRAVDWPRRLSRIFAREAGAAQARLEREAPAVRREGTAPRRAA